MRVTFRARPVKTKIYRSNQWRGPRAMQSVDQQQQVRWSKLMTRCRRMLWVAAGLVGTAAVVWIGSMVAHEFGPILQRGLEIKDVSVEGVHQVTKQDILDRLNLKKGIALHQVSLSYLAERVRTHPWIKEATIERRPLHELRVTIVERKPAAIARIGSEQVLTDEEGVVLARLGARDETALPLLLGVDAKLLTEGDLRLRQRIQSAIDLAKRMALSLDGRIEIDLTHPVNLVASGKGVRFHFGDDALTDQWQRFIKVKSAFKMPALEGRKHEGSDVDLRYDNRVIVRERG